MGLVFRRRRKLRGLEFGVIFLLKVSVIFKRKSKGWEVEKANRVFKSFIRLGKKLEFRGSWGKNVFGKYYGFRLGI